MTKQTITSKPKHSPAGRRLIASAKQILAHARGEISLPMKKFDHSGSSFDSFLEEEGIRKKVEAVAGKRVKRFKRST